MKSHLLSVRISGVFSLIHIAVMSPIILVVFFFFCLSILQSQVSILVNVHWPTVVLIRDGNIAPTQLAPPRTDFIRPVKVAGGGRARLLPRSPGRGGNGYWHRPAPTRTYF